MTKNNIPDINVDDIMKKIREEVAHRKAAASSAVRSSEQVHLEAPRVIPIPNSRETKLWRILKKIQNKLSSYAFYGLLHRIALKIKKYIPKERTGFVLGDFSKYHDESFVRNAYIGILKREPDSQGYFTFLSNLRNGELSKTEILGRLRYTKEGRLKRVKIRGLLLHFSVISISRVPVIGYFINLMISVVRLPKILKGIRKQEAFTNLCFTELRGQLSTKADAQNVKKQIQSLNEELITILSQIRDHKLNILDQQRRLSMLLEEAQKRPLEAISASGNQAEIMLKEKEHIFDALYVAFENRFRGTRDDIKNRLKVYLPYIEKVLSTIGNGTVLDIGCGRGEWLELLAERSFVVKGVDLNRMMVQECRERSFDVTEADAVEYLRMQPSDSLSAVTGFHIIEHLPFQIVISLLDESFRALKTGGVIILETPNPENLLVGTCNFYTDPTHKNPYPPESMTFIMEQRGFSRIEVLRMHVVKNVEPTGQDSMDEIIRRYNMEQDYTVIGYKA